MSGYISEDADLDRAMALHASGALAQAESIYRRVLANAPDDPDALNLLGLLCQDRGAYQESKFLLLKAIDIDPDFPEALTNLARLYLATGEPDAAAQAAGRAIELDPDLAEAHLHLGRALTENGEIVAARHALTECLRLIPGLADAEVFLGIGFAREQNADAALAHFSKAEELGTIGPALLIAMGAALTEAAQLEAALRYQQRAVALMPDNAAAHAALAVTYRRLLDPAASAAACRESLAKDPSRADVWLLLGANCASLGAFDEAEACQHKALTLNPRSAEGRRDLAMIGRFIDSPADIARLHEVLADPQAAETERVAAGFAIGTTCDRDGNPDAAIKALHEANRLLRARHSKEGRTFDRVEFRRSVDWLIATFNEETFPTFPNFGDPSGRPIFIVGMPRSGTSLVEQIVASHPSVHGGGERKDIGEIVRRLDGRPANRPPSEWDPMSAAACAQAYIERIAALSGAKARFTDKLPDNILMLGYIAVLFPNASVLCCRRDPRDVCLSAYFHQFGDGFAWASDLEDCAARALEIERLTDHWLRVLPLRISEVRYEDLIAQPEQETRRMLDLLGLPWDPACLEFHRTARPVMTASYWQVRQPLFSRSVQKWRQYAKHLAGLQLALIGATPAINDDDWPPLLLDPALAKRAASAHLEAGRFEAAEAIYSALARHHLCDPMELHQLGLLQWRGGRLHDAAESLSMALSAGCEDLSIKLDLCRLLLEAGQNEKAIETANALLADHAESTDGWILLANAVACIGDWSRAIDALFAAAKLAPESQIVRVGLARALMEQKEYAQSATWWQAALEVDPGSLECNIGLAAALVELGRDRESLVFASVALAADGQDPIQLVRLANVFFRLQLPETALAVAEAGLRIDPRVINLWVICGGMHSNLGNFDKAAAAFREALALDPESGAALLGLLKIKRGTDADQIVERATRRLGDAGANATDRTAAGFALAGALEQRKEYDAAFEAYERSNKLSRLGRKAGAAETVLEDLQALIRFSKEVFVPDAFLDTMKYGSPSNMPVFIVGMPRSGTTLVEQIAASHPSIAGLGERQDFVNLITDLSGGGGVDAPGAWDVRAVHDKTAAFLADLQSYDPSALRVINKMPDNILWLGHAAVLFPRAHIIICRRDLRDVGWSCFTQNFAQPGMVWTDSLADCAARARGVEALLDHWLDVLPIPLLEVKYEDLVNNLESESRRIIDFLGLPWDPACLSFHQSSRQVVTASLFQVRQPIYSSSIGRWKPYRKHLGPLIDGLEGLVSTDDP